MSRTRSLRRVLAGLLLVGLVGAMVWALLPEPIAVDGARVARGVFEETVEEDGRTRVRNRYVVSSPLAGRLERIMLDAGDRVAQGSVLAVVRPTPPPLLDARAVRE